MATIGNKSKKLSDIRSTVYFLMSENPVSSIFDTASVNTAVNMGLSTVHDTLHSEVNRIFRDTVVGEPSYILPDASTISGDAIVDAVYVNAAPLATAAYSEPSETGTPTTFAVVGSTVILYPTPVAIEPMVVLYRQEFQPLVGDEDTPTMSDIEINAATLYAVYLLKLKDEEFGSSDRFFQAFEDAIKRAQTLQSGVYSPTSAVSYGGVV